MFWQIGEWCLIILVSLFIISQMILPPVIGMRFFWLFRKEERKIQNAEVDYIKAELEEITEKIKDKTELFKKIAEKERMKKINHTKKEKR